ncbi:MAG: TraR/DksA family transcriptional regulator [bacterium]|nr:TraR/DksA family transcriptional regulator [bacterium]
MKNHSDFFQNLKGDVADLADEAEEVIERDLIYHLSLNEKQELEDINIALKKIEEGEYGTCVSCGSEIPIERLKVKPNARYCTKCQEKHERDKRHAVPSEETEEISNNENEE